jgi:hypothetical protein
LTVLEFCTVLAFVMFVAGLSAGVLALVVMGIHREERRYPMRSDPPDAIRRGARAVNGLRVIARPPADSYRQ